MTLYHNFWTQNPKQVIQSIKRLMDFSLASNKNFSKILPSSGLGLGPFYLNKVVSFCLNLTCVICINQYDYKNQENITRWSGKYC